VRDIRHVAVSTIADFDLYWTTNEKVTLKRDLLFISYSARYTESTIPTITDITAASGFFSA
jgi:hypothetical protein